MQRYLAVLTIALFLGIVLMRAIAMRRVGIRAVHFGNIHKTDFLVPPFALFYFYTVFAAAFDLPTVSRQEFFTSEIVSWVGVLLCLAGLGLFVASIASFGKSFRVGSISTVPASLLRLAYSPSAAILFMWPLASF
jgi:hypothetical protein